MQLQTQPDIMEYRLLTSRLAAATHTIGNQLAFSMVSFARVSQKHKASIRCDRFLASTRKPIDPPLLYTDLCSSNQHNFSTYGNDAIELYKWGIRCAKT